MKLVLAEPKYLRDSVAIISELVNEVTFDVDTEKIVLKAMDPANVVMIDFKLLSSAFIEYMVEEPVSISVNMDSFKQILKRAKPSDILTLELDEKRNRLKIVLKGDSIRTFNLALLDIDNKSQKEPKLDFATKVELSTMVFDEAIDDMDIIAESVAFVVDKGTFTIKSESKLSDAVVHMASGEDLNINIKENKNYLSRYSLEYLKKITKSSRLADKVVLRFGDEYPLKAEYRVKDKLDLSFILAPRVSTE